LMMPRLRDASEGDAGKSRVRNVKFCRDTDSA
jgi:hypothetical protein